MKCSAMSYSKFSFKARAKKERGSKGERLEVYVLFVWARNLVEKMFFISCMSFKGAEADQKEDKDRINIDFCNYYLLM